MTKLWFIFLKLYGHTFLGYIAKLVSLKDLWVNARLPMHLHTISNSSCLNILALPLNKGDLGFEHALDHSTGGWDQLCKHACMRAQHSQVHLHLNFELTLELPTCIDSQLDCIFVSPLNGPVGMAVDAHRNCEDSDRIYGYSSSMKSIEKKSSILPNIFNFHPCPQMHVICGNNFHWTTMPLVGIKVLCITTSY